MRPNAWIRILVLAGAMAAAAGCGEDEKQPGPSESPAATVPVTPAPSPAPTEFPTWGLFIIVGPGSNRTTPVPEFGPDATDTGMIEGPQGPATVAFLADRFVDAPPEARAKLASEGFEAAGAFARQDAAGAFFSYVLYGRTSPSPAMFQVRAYTPTGLVAVTRFPDNPVYEFKTSTAVSGNPTITKFPKPLTSDPSGQREVYWSQDGAIYEMTVTGPFTDDEVLNYARTIAATRRGR